MRVAANELPFARPIGQVHGLSSSSIAVEGLSRWLNLGGLIEIEAAHGTELAEVIRLERDFAHCKPYEAGAAIGLGAKVYPRGALLLYPQDSWKGRVIDALGRPVDGGDVLGRGDQAIGIENAPPNAM